MTAYYSLLGSSSIGWYSGIVVLDVVRGDRVLDSLMFNIMHVRTLVEECSLLELDTVRHNHAFLSLSSCDFPAPILPMSSMLMAPAITPMCSHIRGQHVVSPISGVFTTQKLENPNSGAPESRYAPKRNRGWAANPNTSYSGNPLVPHPLLHRQHKSRSAFSMS
jgi:hypothetical protein